MKSLLIGAVMVLGTYGAAEARPAITFLTNGQRSVTLPNDQIIADLSAALPLDNYRAVRVQPVLTSAGAPDHLLVYLHSKTQHRVELVSVQVDSAYKFKHVLQNYQLTKADEQAQAGYDRATSSTAVKCPDETVEFVSAAPNDDDFEQGIAIDVAEAATAAGLKTVQLIGSDANRKNYLNYMSCPKLRGNFYDGDANTQMMVTSDGYISYKDFTGTLKGAFRQTVTNIWLACEAFNNPFKPAVMTTAASRKYAAGINDLEVGPSDNTAACAMKAAIDGKPMTDAFNSCYAQYDKKSDKWGFDGPGSDNFWDEADSTANSTADNTEQ